MDLTPTRRTRSLFLLNPLLLVLLASSAALLIACQTPTTTSAGSSSTALQTFDALYSGALQGETLALKETTAALNAGLITAPQAKQVEGILDSVAAVMGAAHAAVQAGNQGIATANLTQAVGAIAGLSACLMAKPLTPQTFAACSSKLQPVQVQT